MSRLVLLAWCAAWRVSRAPRAWSVQAIQPRRRLSRGSTMEPATTPDGSVHGQYDGAAALAYLRTIGQLKAVRRTGWMRCGVHAAERVESVADHSWRMAAAGFLFAHVPGDDERFDVGRIVQLAVVHDIAEAIVGDIAPSDGVSKQDKQQREDAAMEAINAHLGSWSRDGRRELEALYHEYEARETPEARAVKDLDMLEMVVQADEYEQKTGMDLSDFFRSVEGKFRTRRIQAVYGELVAARARRRACNGSLGPEDQAADGTSTE